MESEWNGKILCGIPGTAVPHETRKPAVHKIFTAAKTAQVGSPHLGFPMFQPGSPRPFPSGRPSPHTELRLPSRG